LRIDLGAGAATTEPLNMEWAEHYMGGKGLLFRYMWEYVPPQVDPWSPENPVFLVTGPFAGTNVSTASRLVVGPRAPSRAFSTTAMGGIVRAGDEVRGLRPDRDHRQSARAGVFVNGRNVRQGEGLAMPLNEGNEIRLLPPIAGG